MKTIYKTSETLGHLSKVPEYCDGNWVCLIAPTPEEIQDVSQHYGIDLQDLVFALDEDERARVDADDDYTMIIIDVPYKEEEEESGESYYGTVPLAIILGDKEQRYIITVCLRELALLDDFFNGRVKKFYTYKKTRFILQILYRNASYYLYYLRMLERSISSIENALHRSTRNEELFKLLSLDKSLVFLSNSLRANDLVLDRLLRLEAVKKYPEDKDLLEDVIVENKQAIAMANVYSSVLDVTMEAYSSVISNNLNTVMKILTSITFIMTIPTMIFSFFGMNVPLPWSDNPAGVWLIGGISLVAVGVAAVFMKRRKLF
ncbi:MAG: magnesium transporter CorA family protein [Peptococcaceae bacterium]|nr:magnesium transporter CorA family protein [Peptococcaceae bacterium]